MAKTQSDALAGRFVGREAEMGLLQELWERAQDDVSRLVLVSGATGVG